MSRTFVTAAALGFLGWIASTWIYATPTSIRLADALSETFHLGEPRSAGFGAHVQVWIAALSALVGGLLACCIPQNVLRWTAVLVATALIGTLTLVLAMYGRLFEPLTVMAALLFAALFGTFYQRTPWGSQTERLNALLGPGMSSDSLQATQEARPSLRLEHEPVEVAVLSVTFANASHLRSSLDRPAYLELCRRVSEATGPLLQKNGGFLDQQSPENVRAFFGLPGGASVEDFESAATAALEVRDALRQLCDKSDSELHISIGVAAGPVAAGTFGKGEASYFSAVGPVVDRSRKLCKVAIRNGSILACDSEIVELTGKDFTFRPLELLEFGEDGVLAETFELLGPTDSLDSKALEEREQFWKGVIFFREQRYDQALEAFETCTSKDETDAVLEKFKSRTRKLAGKTAPA